MNNLKRFQELLLLYINGNASKEEITELALLTEQADDDTVFSILEQHWAGTGKGEAVFTNEEAVTILNNMKSKRSEKSLVKPLFSKKRMYSLAAAAVVVMGFFMLYKFMAPAKNTPLAVQPVKQDVSPGSNKAILVLADGSSIILDSATNGLLATQGSGKVVKTAQGLKYEAGSAGELMYNTVQTPRGGEYFIVLSDGTKVWLNAASALKYPTRFSASERKVELKGEGYFEVAKNTASPFIITVEGKGEVEVLGTHFNINAYSNEESVNTTLIEGKIKFTAINEKNGGENVSQVLSPGQQARLLANGKLTVVNNVNTEEITAWKDGQFYFESADMKTILRQMERWYDIDVVYETAMSNRKYFAIISRKSTLTEVLKALQANDIRYRIEGKRLIVQGG